MGKILGLDVGDVRVGTALADSAVRIATPHLTFQRANGVAEAKIIELIQGDDIRVLVAGMPFYGDGSKSPQCEKVERFCRRISRRVGVEFVYVDEQMTSEESKHRLGETGFRSKRGRDRGIIDALAASIILQNYLDLHFQKGSS